MKAVVLEVKDGFAALLQDDGTVVKLRDRSFTPGDVVDIKEKAMRRKVGLRAMAAAAAIFFMLTGAGALIYDTPAYYVSLDVNPSVMMEVNLFERVIGMEALNEDAKDLLKGLALKNKNIEDVISEIISRLEENGYFDEEGANILIASAAKSEEKAERLAGKLRGAVEDEIADNGFRAEVSAGAVGYEMVQEAKALGITPGKLNIITNLLGEEVGDNINESVRDLMTRFTATKGVQGRERAQEAGKPEEAGEPEGAGKPEGAGESEGAGKPEGVGKPEDIDKPDGIGKPGGVGNPGGVGKP